MTQGEFNRAIDLHISEMANLFDARIQSAADAGEVLPGHWDAIWMRHALDIQVRSYRCPESVVLDNPQSMGFNRGG